MARQEQIRPAVNHRKEHADAVRVERATQSSKAQDHAERKAETDAILDDIEEVLEESAAEFVASYRQKGGE